MNKLRDPVITARSAPNRAVRDSAGAWTPVTVTLHRSVARGLLCALAAGVSLVPGGVAHGQCETAQLVPVGGTDSDRFGAAVAVSSDGDRVAVGADTAFYSLVGDNTGAVYVFEANSGWGQQVELRASDAAPDDYYGKSVAITADGNVLIISAPGVDHEGVQNTGAVYVVAWDGAAWVEQAKLTVPGAAINDGLGESVGVSADGTTLIASTDNVGNATGAVYVFVLTAGTWNLEATLTASDGIELSRFGVSAALSGDGNTALVGAEWAENYAGAAYVFTRQGETWSQQAKLNGFEAVPGDLSGKAVALSQDGNVALVGAHNDSGQELFEGSAYVFVRDGQTWTQQQKLTASDAAMFDRFGDDVALSGDGTIALIGARADTEGGGNSGSVYVFDRSGGMWQEQYKATASDAAPQMRFGNAIALAAASEVVVISAEGSLAIPVAGSAYVFLAGGPDCNANDVADGCDINPTVHIYRLDDGGADESIGTGGGGDIIWLNQFTVYPGAEVIASVDLAWGVIAEGTPTDIAIWSDPNNDGNPVDAQLLTLAGPVPASNPASSIFTTVSIPPTFVGNPGDSYFVGAHSHHEFDEGPAALDQGESQGRSWAAGGSNLENLGQNQYFGTIDSFGYPGNWLIRAGDNPDAASVDADGNGIPDECSGPGDIDGDGTVGILDFLLMLTEWGPCTDPCPPSCPADLDGDCNVGIVDFLILLANWG